MSQSSGIFEAATVLLLRPAPGGSAKTGPEAELEVGMVRRSSKSQFMPDAVVFPGGRVDPEDAQGEGGAKQRFVAAARRECKEEVNLDLSAQELHWFDTWKTPSGEGPKRFLARFFIAFIDRDSTRDSKADEHETHDLQWASAQYFLTLAHKRQLILAPPTYCVLNDLLRCGPQTLRERSPEECAQIVLPKVRPHPAPGPSTTDSKDKRPGRDIIMPHHPDYPALQGDSAPAPSRLRHQPQCFRYQDSFYVPQADLQG